MNTLDKLIASARAVVESWRAGTGPTQEQLEQLEADVIATPATTATPAT